VAVTAIVTPEQITAAQQAADQADRELTQLQRQASPWTEIDSSLALRIEVALAHRDTAHRDAERVGLKYVMQCSDLGCSCAGSVVDDRWMLLLSTCTGSCVVCSV
jgi:hypothetical protein